MQSGAGYSYTSGTTLTISAANVVDTGNSSASAPVVFVVPDIVAPAAATPPVTIAVDNFVQASELNSSSITFTHAAAIAGDALTIYRNGARIKSVAMTPAATSTTVPMVAADWGADASYTITSKISDAAGNIGPASAPKTVTVDSSVAAGFRLATTLDAGTSGVADQGDVVRITFNESVGITTASLPSIFGSGATVTAVTGVNGHSTAWDITLGSNPTIAPGSTFNLSSVIDVAGNSATLSGSASADLFRQPSAPTIDNVATNNVVDATERSTALTVSVNLGRAKANDVVTLYMDGVQVQTGTVTSDGQTSITFNRPADSWGADGTRLLTASVQRGTFEPVLSRERPVYIAADSGHWSTVGGSTIWFDPDTLTQADGSIVSSWSSSASAMTLTTFGSASVEAATSASGSRILIFDGTGGLRSTAAWSPVASAGITTFAMVKYDVTPASYRYVFTQPITVANGAQSRNHFGTGATGSILTSHVPNANSDGVYINNALTINNWMPLISGFQASTAYLGFEASFIGSLTINLNSTTLPAYLNQGVIVGGTSASGGGDFAVLTGADMITIQSFITPSMRQEVASYIAAKYQSSGNQRASTALNSTYQLDGSALSTTLVDDMLQLQSNVVGSGNDVVVTAGADYVNAGNGADIVRVKDLNFRYVDGGLGSDTLALDVGYSGSNSIVLADFVSNARGMSGVTADDLRVNTAGYHKLLGFETIDTSISTAAQTLVISAIDVNQLSETNDLHVKLGSNDVIVATGFTGSVTYGFFTFEGVAYDRQWTTTIGSQTINLYARDGDTAPSFNSASANGTTVSLELDQAMAPAAPLLASDFSINASIPTAARLDGSGNMALTLTSASTLTGTVIVDYTGAQLNDLQGDSIRFKSIAIGTNAAETITRISQTTPQAIFGNGGDDTLVGGSGGNLIVGGAGNDTLTGAAGADTFAWKLGESSTDTVTNFVRNQGDKIDLSGLLAGSGITAATASAYLQLTQAISDAVLKIDIDGGGNFVSPTQTITFTGAWGASNLSDIASMLDQRVLLT